MSEKETKALKVKFIISLILILLCMIGILSQPAVICVYPPLDHTEEELRDSIPLNEKMIYKGRIFRVYPVRKIVDE